MYFEDKKSLGVIVRPLTRLLNALLYGFRRLTNCTGTRFYIQFCGLREGNFLQLVTKARNCFEKRIVIQVGLLPRQYFLHFTLIQHISAILWNIVCINMEIELPCKLQFSIDFKFQNLKIKTLHLLAIICKTCFVILISY